MKRLLPVLSFILIIIAASACSHTEDKTAATAAPPLSKPLASESSEVRGTVRHLITNPGGEINGLILSDGTQISCPANMSPEITKIISANDPVTIVGVRDNDKILRAQKITNTATNQSVAMSSEEVLPAGETGQWRGYRPVPMSSGMKQLRAQGTIKSQIFDQEGQVSGVVLSDKSVVRFGPQVLGKSKAKVEVGKSIKASGYGTQSSTGKSIEATSISNY